MTKMGIRTAPDCRSDIPGLLAAGLAQAGCANHFAGFHIGLCIGNGWIAGRSAVEDLDSAPAPRVDPKAVRAIYDETLEPLDAAAEADSDRILRDLQQIMFAYDVGILKRADRLHHALQKVMVLAARAQEASAPHVHELVRLKETEAMLLAAQLILGASLYRTESRLSHFREDYEQRDDANWLCWVDVAETEGTPAFRKTPVPTPYCAVTAPTSRPKRLHKRLAVTGV
jgi:succinate dehydrogenase/fumarate reductase flavoprotein subunit